MPVRIEPPDGPDVTVYRSVAWGDLARFYVLDGRQYRSDQACGAPSDVGVACAEVGDDERTMLGGEQERWLGRALDDSEATWNVVAQQTIMSRIVVPLGPAEGLNLDQWDGYPAARRRLVDQLREVDNPVVITGDIHASGVGVVTADPDDPATPAVVPELVGTSISSTFPSGLVDVFESAAAACRPSATSSPPAGLRGVRGHGRRLTADFRYWRRRPRPRPRWPRGRAGSSLRGTPNLVPRERPAGSALARAGGGGGLGRQLASSSTSDRARIVAVTCACGDRSPSSS